MQWKNSPKIPGYAPGWRRASSSLAWLPDDCGELRSMENTHASHCGPTKSIISMEDDSTHHCT